MGNRWLLDFRLSLLDLFVPPSAPRSRLSSSVYVVLHLLYACSLAYIHSQEVYEDTSSRRTGMEFTKRQSSRCRIHHHERNPRSASQGRVEHHDSFAAHYLHPIHCTPDQGALCCRCSSLRVFVQPGRRTDGLACFGESLCHWPSLQSSSPCESASSDRGPPRPQRESRTVCVLPASGINTMLTDLRD